MRPIIALLLAVAFFTNSTAPALPSDPNLKLDPTYGLFPRPSGHQYFPSPQDWRDINIYQLFTDRFADGDSANNTTSAMGINRSPWFVNNSGRSFPHNRNFHHGGDWKGLKDNLDYLTGMGVNAVWISGVQMNAQGRDGRYTPYHQYHPTDFFNVDPAQGTFQELKDLIDTCHSRGIYVILDVVINHTADLNGLWGNNREQDKQYWPNGNDTFGWWDNNRIHPYPFNALTSFHRNGTINNWDAFPETLLGQFRGTDDLATETGHVTYWITEAFKNLIDATDCDGFRVDAIKHVDNNWVKKWADDIRKHAATKGKNDFILFGELFVYDNNALASYCREPGYSFNSALFFPMSQTIKSVFVDGAGTGQLTQALNAKTQYGEGENRLVTFIDNHDVNRISIQNSGDTGNDIWKLRPSLSFLYLATPVPCLYYGTEHAFNQGNHFNGSDAWQLYEGQSYDDADWQRECMFDRGFQPGPAQGNKLAATDAPLYQHIAKLNAARKAHPALTRGSFTERWQSGSAGPYAFTRVLQDQEALVAFNTGDNQSAAINPQVAKPNGTEFTNVLNPSEKVTVSGGRISFSLAGKDTKIFVAGSLSKPSEARATSDASNVTITYTPNDGPLKTGTAPIQIGVKIDGGAEQFENMTAGPNGIWTYTRPYAGINATLAVAFRDSAAIPVVDRTGGAAWTFDATKFGQSLIQWVGNTATFPPQGNITASADLWVDIEAWPLNTAAGGKVVYTTNNGTNWNDVPLAKARVVGNNDLLNANLGKFPGGTTLKFAVQVLDTNGVARWDNNNGQDYTRTIQFGTLAIQWSGRVNHWPLDGAIEPTSDFWINIESYPQNAGIGGEVLYSSDNGTTWQAKPLTFRIAQDNNDFWNCNLGTFPAGSKLKYAVKLTDTTGVDHWHNNSGANFAATVNGIASSLTTVGAPQARGQSPAQRPDIALRFTGNGSLVMDANNRNAANTYTIEQSESLASGNWTTLRTIPAGSESAVWDLLNAASLSGKVKGFFRVRATGGESQQVYANNPARISIAANQNGATAANLVYTVDGGVSWITTSMFKTASQNGSDIWSVDLAGRPQGSGFRYAVELVDQQNNSRWINNGGNDYTVNVVRPGQTDVVPPTASHSPSNTVTSAQSLVLTLTANDNVDSSPQIRYTTDGSAPGLASPLYSGPLTISTNTTIRYFAIDNEGNQSPVTSVNVVIGQTQDFGPNKPYSTNPSLGKSVANNGITIDGANTSNEWTDDKLIALGMANDDPRSLGSNWTMHEAPINITHMWAAWDDNNLYLAWQFVDVTDVIDSANAGGAGSGRIGTNDGILQWIALDTKADAGASKDMWKKNGNQTLWNGTNKPDFQIYLAGSLWQGFISRAVNNVFPVDDGAVNYFKILGGGSATQLGFQAGKGALFAGTSLWGVDDADARRNTGAPTRNFMTQGHNGARDSFYEIKIPLSFLGLTKAQLESQGLGVMIGAGSESAMDVLPQDDGATLNTQGVESYNSSLEWADTDTITTPFARVGAW